MTIITKDEIIALALEVGAVFDVLAMGRHDGVLFTQMELERFAHLCRADLVAENEGWKADQKENLANQCDLQAEINELRAEVAQLKAELLTAIGQEQDRNFCPRRGKRTGDLSVIHSCTPPEEKPAPDYCTDPDNCKRCKTHPDHRGDMEHAGIGKRP